RASTGGASASSPDECAILTPISELAGVVRSPTWRGAPVPPRPPWGASGRGGVHRRSREGNTVGNGVRRPRDKNGGESFAAGGLWAGLASRMRTGGLRVVWRLRGVRRGVIVRRRISRAGRLQKPYAIGHGLALAAGCGDERREVWAVQCLLLRLFPVFGRLAVHVCDEGTAQVDQCRGGRCGPWHGGHPPAARPLPRARAGGGGGGRGGGAPRRRARRPRGGARGEGGGRRAPQ